MADQHPTLPVTITSMDDTTATLDLNGQSISVPRSHLPAGSKAGDTAYLILLTAESASNHHATHAKAVLNEVLKGDTDAETDA